MKIQLKSKDEIEKLRYACQLAAEVLDMITEHVKAGVSTKYLDDLCFQLVQFGVFTITLGVIFEVIGAQLRKSKYLKTMVRSILHCL